MSDNLMDIDVLLDNDEIENTCCFTGHRPNKLGNCYSLKHLGSIKISNILYPHLKQLYDEKGVQRFISGGAIGFDQIAFWTVQKLKQIHGDVINIVAVPFKNQMIKWTDEETLFWYNKMLNVADDVIYVDTIDRYRITNCTIGEYHVAKMQKRNEYMVDQSKYLFSCFDGTKGGTSNCVSYALKKNKYHYRINPKKNYELSIQNTDET